MADTPKPQTAQAQRPAARLVPQQKDNLNTATPFRPPEPDEVKRKEPEQMQYRPTGLQRGPSFNGAQFTVPRPAPAFHPQSNFARFITKQATPAQTNDRPHGRDMELENER